MITGLIRLAKLFKFSASAATTLAVDDIAFDGAGRKRVGKVFTDVVEKGPIDAAKEAAAGYQELKEDVQGKKRAVAGAIETGKGVVTGDPEALKRVGGGLLDKAKAAKDAVLGDAPDGGTNWWKWLFGAGGAGVATWFGLSKLFGDSKKDEKPAENNGFSFGTLFVSALAILGAVVAWKHFNLSEKFQNFANKGSDSPSAAVPLDKKLSFSTPTGDFVTPAADPATPVAAEFINKAKASVNDPKAIADAAIQKAKVRSVGVDVPTEQIAEHETLEI